MEKIHVMTMNILCDYGQYEEEFSFGKRTRAIESCLRAESPDVIGFQEVLPHQRKWLEDTFPDYMFCGTGRGSDYLNEGTPVAFRKDRFDLVFLETFWLSDTPGVPGSRFHTDQSFCPRICTTVTLRDRESRHLFRHYNTHLDHEGETAKAQGMSVILCRMAEDYLKQPLPVILTGDFNSVPGSPAYRSAAGFEGCGAVLTDAAPGTGGTYHDFRPGEVDEKIDHIFTTLRCDTSESYTTKGKIGGTYPSDHWPVSAWLDYQK